MQHIKAYDGFTPDSSGGLYTDVAYTLFIAGLTASEPGYMGYMCSQHRADFMGVFCGIWYFF